MSINTVIILAGGLGTRLRASVKDVPKPMAPINNVPFLRILLDFWIDSGISNIIISIGYMGEVISSYFGPTYRNISITYVSENKPLGTGGAIKNIIDRLNLSKDVYIVNGDTFFEIDIHKLSRSHIKNKSKLSIALFKYSGSDFQRYKRIFIDNNDKILEYNEDSSFYANGGIYILNPGIFKSYQNETSFFSFEENFIPYIHSLKLLIYGVVFDNYFIDIGVPEDFEAAKRYFGALENYKKGD